MNGDDRNGSARDSQRRRRLPTLDQAIQYSPFSSVVPFDPSIVPLPLPYPHTSFSSILTQDQQQTAAQLVESLNIESTQTQGPSSRLEQTLEDVRALLGSDDLTEYVFKTPVRSDSQVLNGKGPTGHEHPVNSTGLGAFAQLVANTAKLSYRCPSQKSIKSSTPHKLQEPGSGLQTSGFAANGKQSGSNNGAFQQNALAPNQYPKAEQGIVRTQQGSDKPRVFIPNSSQTSNTEEYERYPELDAAILKPPPEIASKLAVSIPGMPSSSDPSQYQKDPALDAAILKAEEFNFRKRKREDHDEQEIAIDHQDRIQEAVREFQKLCSNLFEVADNLEPDKHGYFVSSLSEQEDASVLSQGFLVRLETALQNVIKARAILHLEAEDLIRLQRLCAKSLSLSAELPATLPDGADEDSTRAWIIQLEAIENSLQSSKIILKIMTAGSDDKQLHSEEILQELLDNLKHVLDDVLVPVVEQRTSSASSDVLQHTETKSLLSRTLQKAGRSFRYIGDLLLQVDLSERIVTSIEFMSTKLLFVENATIEKEAILGIQKFETLRRHAMDVVAKLFLRHPGQRTFIFDEILSSLEKLPTTKQGVKHFRTSDGKLIRVVSALIMQLIQTSTIPSPKIHQATNGEEEKSEDDVEALSDEDYDDQSDDERRRKKSQAKKAMASPRGDPAIHELRHTISPLLNGAQKSANHVVTFLVKRALASTKSGDEPYRQLLDDFTEDFVSVLGSTEFPGAELLLRFLLTQLVRIVEGDKSPAPSKNMSLDLMGRMGSSIADLRSFTAKTLRSFEDHHGGEHNELARLAEEAMENKTLDRDFLTQDGPFRMVIEHLRSNELDDVRLQSARCYNLIQWAQAICSVENSLLEEQDEMDKTTIQKHSKLANMVSSFIDQPDRLLDSSTLEANETLQIKLASALLTVNSQFCKALPRILGILFVAMSSNQVTVRNRGLKSVVQVLEKDPAILERSRHVLNNIVNATSDASPMVRESALNLLGKCISLKPTLEAQFLKTILAKTSDPGVSVRKKAMRLLKEVYTRNEETDVRAAIADAILVCLEDVEDTAKEVARQIIEEIWIVPFRGVSPDIEQSVKVRQELQSHVQLIVATAQRGDHVLLTLENLFHSILKKDGKDQAATRDMCKVLVTIMFDMIIDNDSTPGRPSQPAVLQTLTIFAKAEPRLFTSDQMETLRPYIQNLSSSEDLLVYRSVIVIFRCVLPILPPLQHNFLEGVQKVLFSSISRLGKIELDEVATCLSIIDSVLKNTEKLANLVASVVVGIETEKASGAWRKEDPKAADKLKRYMMIAGYFGKACDLELFKSAFAKRLPSWKIDSVCGLLTDVITQFTGPQVSEHVREQALESTCLICQAWPKNFLKQTVTGAFTAAFRERNVTLETALLSGFKAFYYSEEARSKTTSDDGVSNGTNTGSEKLANSMVLSDNDGASTSIAQQFLPEIIRIALQSRGELALTATELVASINRQGLVHPKEIGPALVAIETSPDERIAKIAFEGHQALHHKHESMLEKEYLKAIEKTFAYQKDTFGELSGVNASLAPKLHSFYEVLKQGSITLRRKLLANLCARVNIDPSKVSHQPELQAHCEYGRFVMENLALFEYCRIDELLHLIGCIEKIFTTTGNPISQRIETLLNLNMEPGQEMLTSTANGSNFAELRALTIASVVITMFWETRSHLRRTWNLPQAKESKQKTAAREVNKPPTKSSHAPSPERLLERFKALLSSLANEETMTGQCRAFVELMNIDGDLKIENSDEDGLNGPVFRYGTPSEDGMKSDGTPAPGSALKTKRKGSTSAGSTPRKRGRPPGSGVGMGRRKSSTGFSKRDDDEDGWD